MTTISGVFNQIFRPTAHAAKQAAKATDAMRADPQKATRDIAAMLRLMENAKAYNVGYSNAGYRAETSFRSVDRAQSLNGVGAGRLIEAAREIKHDVRLQLIQARSVVGGKEAWHGERYALLTQIEAAARKVQHFNLKSA